MIWYRKLNNYKSQHKRLYFQSTAGLTFSIKSKYRRIHKVQKAITFIEKCQQHMVQPKFCQLQVGFKKHLNKDEILKFQQRNLNNELKNHQNELPLLKNAFHTFLFDLKNIYKQFRI